MHRPGLPKALDRLAALLKERDRVQNTIDMLNGRAAFARERLHQIYVRLGRLDEQIATADKAVRDA